MEIYIDCFDQQERTVYKDITKCPTIPVEKEFPISFDFDPRGYSLSLDMTFKDVDGSPYSQVFGIHIHANGRYRIFINDGITDLSLEKNLQHG